MNGSRGINNNYFFICYLKYIYLVLFQRGLRINKESKKLWIEYCKIELLYIRKIKKRWNILGLLPSTV